MRGLNYKTRFVDVAGEVNSEMPVFWSRKVADALNEDAKSIRGSRILMLGVSYKKDIDDIRESPALDILTLLIGQGAEVRYHDPCVSRFEHDDLEFESVALSVDELDWADCVVIVTDHTNVDYDIVRRSGKTVVDTRNVLG
jgi:UDP-N-acetyl-D-glucosamine dehydrogenase